MGSVREIADLSFGEARPVLLDGGALQESKNLHTLLLSLSAVGKG